MMVMRMVMVMPPLPPSPKTQLPLPALPIDLTLTPRAPPPAFRRQLQPQFQRHFIGTEAVDFDVTLDAESVV